MIDDRIPSIGSHRGVPLHDHQNAARIQIVKAEIDFVHCLMDADTLAAYAADPAHSPESRHYAAARVEALWELAAVERRTRPPISLDRLRASTAGLASQCWRSPMHYCSDLDDVSRAASRERPLE